jgi:hypothetical protein
MFSTRASLSALTNGNTSLRLKRSMTGFDAAGGGLPES